MSDVDKAVVTLMGGVFRGITQTNEVLADIKNATYLDAAQLFEHMADNWDAREWTRHGLAMEAKRMAGHLRSMAGSDGSDK